VVCRDFSRSRVSEVDDEEVPKDQRRRALRQNRALSRSSS
jgi:hypothetical protein